MSHTYLASRTASTTHPILEVLAERWSPRSFQGRPVDAAKLDSALEAARWSPSANNVQPWRFIVASHGTEAFDTIVDALLGFNQSWAVNAGALLVGVAVTTDAEGKPQPWAQYDLGQAVAHLSIQAHHDGLHVHQMGGFDPEALRTAFGLAEGMVPLSVSAIGDVDSPEALPEGVLREREAAPRERLALDDIVLVRQ